MKINYKFTLFIAAITILLLALTGCAGRATLSDDRTVIGETYTLEEGRILNGNLNVIGGVVEIKETAVVNRDVFVLGGLVTIDGTIKGNLTAIGGTVNLNDTAVLEGDLISPVSFININPNASILGDRIEEWILPGIGIAQFTNLSPHVPPARTISVISILTQIGKFLATTLVMVALGAFLLLVMPKPAERMASALVSAPWHLLGYGALTAVVMASALILTITICLIPLVILAGLVFALAALTGWLALGYELGKRIASSIFNTTWHPVLAAALGNLVLYLLAWGVNRIPCIGWFLVFIAILFGLGMAVATLFGSYPYPRTGVREDEQEPVVLFDQPTAPPAAPPAIDEPIVPQPVTQAQEAQAAVKPEIPIEALNLGSRINNTLLDAGILTVDDVLAQLEGGDEAMLAISGIGEKSLQDLKAALKSLGYEIPKAADQ